MNLLEIDDSVAFVYSKPRACRFRLSCYAASGFEQLGNCVKQEVHV